METLKQCPTPLNTLYFSPFNVNVVQRGIRQYIKQKTGASIDYQNSGDVFAIMRVVFISNEGDPYGDVCAQVKRMNQIAVIRAGDQVITGLSQYMGYLRDSASSLNLMNLPANTSSAGIGMGQNKIGLIDAPVNALKSAYGTVATGAVSGFNAAKSIF